MGRALRDCAHGDVFGLSRFAGYFQKSRNLSGDISVYLTVSWMFLCPVLQRAGVVAIVGELEAAGVAQHVRMDCKWHPCGLAEPSMR